MPAPQTKVALSSNYLASLPKPGSDEHRRVVRFTGRFKHNPKDVKYIWESVDGSPDERMRVVRVDDAEPDMRAVVMCAKRTRKVAVFILLHVDSREAAVAWAQGNVCEVHPVTGAVQVYPYIPTPKVVELRPPEGHANLRAFSDEDLLKLGVPASLIAFARTLRDDAHLDENKERFPQEAWEGLGLVLRGEADSVESVFAVLRSTVIPNEGVDTEDFETALESATSRQRFVVLTDDASTEAILNAPLERWRVFLHASQRRRVEMKASGPWRVLGGAGTGKTVVLMHRAAHLATHTFTQPHDRILLTTYTANLAADIAGNLAKICPPDALERIEVIHLDRWVSSFLRNQGHTRHIRFYEEKGGNELYELWKEALEQAPEGLGFRPEFYRQEWEDVVQYHGCERAGSYMRASRAGRGVGLDRKKRKAIWPVFEEYRELMADNGLCERTDALRIARKLIEAKPGILPYTSILIDEAQDMGQEAFRLVHAIVNNPGEASGDAVFIVGDGHQKIYGRKVVLSHTGLNIIGRSSRLRLNYRTTEQIRDYAVKMLEGGVYDNLDGESDDHRGYKSVMRGPAPELAGFDSLQDEVDHIAKLLLEMPEEERRNVCIVVRTKPLLESYEEGLRRAGIETCRLRRSVAENRSHEGVRVATMHRVKGLEFEHVIVAAARDKVLPLADAINIALDPKTRKTTESRERALLYVSLTRAKKRSMITWHGEPSPFLRNL